MLKLTLTAVLAVSLGGCALLTGDKTPIASVPDASREVVQPGLNEPEQIKLTRPAKVAGVELAAGSVIKRDGERNYRFVSAGPTVIYKVPIPAGSEVEMVRADSIDRWNWNGVVHAGAATTYGEFPVQAGDRVVFNANPFLSPVLTKVQFGQGRAFRGQDYPDGMLFEIDKDGKIAAYTPAEQAAREQARKEQNRRQAARNQQCSAQCSIVTDPSEHGVCMMNCREGS